MTPLNDLVEFVRATIGDIHAAAYEYSDDHVLTALRMVLRGGKVRGFALAPSLSHVEPALEDPNAWLLTVYEAAMVLVRPRTESYRYATRALTESFGGQHTLFWALSHEIDALQRLRDGEFFTTWQDFRQYCIGNYGTSVWDRLVSLTLSSPAWNVHLSAAGATST